MARRPRRELTDGIYHATARGTGRIPIVLDDVDCNAFMSLLRRVARLWTWQIGAFCLMPNHYHLILQTSVERLSMGMHALNGRYARRFNLRHSRTGHLFQERFDARLIESEAHLETACEYVLANPVRAGLVADPESWPWSAANPHGR
jgi:REP element-mobilizing transposase RayT